MPLSFAQARDLMDLLGVNSSIDQAAAKMQGLIDRAREAAFALELQTNKDATSRIAQIDEVITNAIADITAVESKTQTDIDAILSKYTDAFKSLEVDAFKQLAAEIDHAECAADKTLNQHMQDTLGSFGRLINTNSFEIVPPLMYANEQECGFLGCGHPSKVFKVDAPDFTNTYTEVRGYINSRLNQSRDDTPIASVLRSYNIIASVANRAGCLTNLHEEYAEEAAPYMAKIKMWERVTGEKGVPVP